MLALYLLLHASTKRAKCTCPSQATALSSALPCMSWPRLCTIVPPSLVKLYLGHIFLRAGVCRHAASFCYWKFAFGNRKRLLNPSVAVPPPAVAAMSAGASRTPLRYRPVGGCQMLSHVAMMALQPTSDQNATYVLLFTQQ